MVEVVLQRMRLETARQAMVWFPQHIATPPELNLTGAAAHERNRPDGCD